MKAKAGAVVFRYLATVAVDSVTRRNFINRVYGDRIRGSFAMDSVSWPERYHWIEVPKFFSGFYGRKLAPTATNWWYFPIDRVSLSSILCNDTK